MANCRYGARIGAYHDGEIADSETRELEAHLAGCADCRKSLQAMKRLSDLAASHLHSTIPGSLFSKLRNIPNRNPWGDLLPTARFLLGFSTLLLIVSVGFSTTKDETFSSMPQSWEEMAGRNSENEIIDEPEAEITRWVVAGLTEGIAP